MRRLCHPVLRLQVLLLVVVAAVLPRALAAACHDPAAEAVDVASTVHEGHGTTPPAAGGERVQPDGACSHCTGSACVDAAGCGALTPAIPASTPHRSSGEGLVFPGLTVSDAGAPRSADPPPLRPPRSLA